MKLELVFMFLAFPGLFVLMGSVYTVTVAAATAILGYDMFRDEPWTVSENDRVITGIAVLGSAAALDAGVDLKVGQTTVVREYNRTTGYPNMDDVMPLNAAVPAGSKINCPVIDAPATNPLNIKVVIEDLN